MWPVATALGNGVLQENLWSPRCVVLFPVLALFVAVGVYVTVRLIIPSIIPNRWLYVVLAAVSLSVATVQAIFYFHDQVPFFVQSQNYEDWTDAFFRMEHLPPGTHVHFIMDSPVWQINIDSFVAFH